LPELVGDAGLVFCQANPNDLKNKLRESLSNAKHGAVFREKGFERAKDFSWPRTAEIVWKNLHDI